MTTLTSTTDAKGSALAMPWAGPSHMHAGSATAALAQGTSFARWTAATVAIAATTVVTTFSSMTIGRPWIHDAVLPETASAWDNSATTRQHPTMTSSAVQQFMRLSPQADARALADIFDVVMAHFSDVPDLDASYSVYVDPDTNDAQLILDIDTHGIDTDEQLRRELLMREQIFSDDRMRAAKAYNVIAVV